MATVVISSSEQQRSNKNENSNSDDVNQATSSVALTSSSIVYDVEHLATFSTTGSHETPSSNYRLVSNDGDGANQSLITNNNNEISANSPPAVARSSGNFTANSTETTLPAPTTAPKIALQRLFELEKQSGIWTQRMQIELQNDCMLIVDCETNSVVERFERECVTKPEAFNEYNDIYNNIVVFVIQQSKSSSSQKRHEEEVVSRGSGTDSDTSLKIEEGELHIFQCVSHEAQQLVSDILNWKIQSNFQGLNKMANLSVVATSENIKDNQSSSERDQNESSSKQQEQEQKQVAMSANQKNNLNNQTSQSKQKVSPTSNKSLSSKPMVKVASSSNASENVPIVNVNVKETVQVFNQIAALREKG